jgi:diguanylate cyclase (GGDEF)-like protein
MTFHIFNQTMKLFSKNKSDETAQEKSLPPENRDIEVLHFLNEINISNITLPEYFESIYEKLREYLSLSAFGIILFDFGEDKHIERFMRGHNLFDIENAFRKILWIRDSEEMNNDVLVYIPDITQQKPALQLNTHSLSQICLPLKSGKKLLGAMLLETDSPNGFHGKAEFSKILETILVNQIQNFFWRRELTHKKEQIIDYQNVLRSILGIIKKINSDCTHPPADLYQNIISLIKNKLKFSQAFIFRCAPENDSFELLAKTDNATYQSVTQHDLTDILNNSFKAGKYSFLSQVERDIQHLKPFIPSSDTSENNNFMELLITPLYNESKELIGFLAGNKDFHNYLPDEQQILVWEILAHITQIAIEFCNINIQNERLCCEQEKNVIDQDKVVQLEDKLRKQEEEISTLKFDLAQKQLEVDSSKSFNPNDRIIVDDDHFTSRGEFDLLHLYNLSLILNSTLNIDNILSIIAEQTLQIAGTQSCKISIIDIKTNDLVTNFIFGASSMFGTSIAPTTGEEFISEWVLENDRILIISNVEEEERFGDLSDLTEAGVFSTLAIPMRMGGKTIGILQTYGYEPTDFSEHDIRLLTVLSTEAAISISNAQLLTETNRMAITDELTGVYNYRYFYDKLVIYLDNDNLYPISLVMIDVDNLKKYNDSYGHLYGSQSLKETAKIIKKNVSDNDIVAKYGGDEFSVIMPKTTKMEAFAIAEQIRNQVEEHKFSSGEDEFDGRLSLSIGIAECPRDAKKWQPLLNKADKALYCAKNGGRNQSCIFKEGMTIDE